MCPVTVWCVKYISTQDIIRSGKLQPFTSDSFVSFSTNPHFADIRGRDMVLVFDKRVLTPHVEEVEYDEDWYDKHQEQASYIAGEGWREQFSLPDYEDYPNYDPDDEFWEPDPDDDAAFERDAELEAFLAKSGEREWISKAAGRAIPPRGLSACWSPTPPIWTGLSTWPENPGLPPPWCP